MYHTQSLEFDVPLKNFTTFGIAVVAKNYLRVTEVAQLQQLRYLDLPLLVLGGGSNLIFTKDFPGIVLHMAITGRKCIGDDEQNYYVTAAAGESWHDFVQWTLAQGWGGLENLSLIPGLVGAAPIQNIGAYGVELADCFHSLSWLDFATGEIRSFKLADCEFNYRDSVFKHSLKDKGVILDVTFALPKKWVAKLDYGDLGKLLGANTSPTAKQISEVVCAIRQSKLPDPKVIGNAGSFFKNPIVSADKLAKLMTRYPGLVSYPQADGQYKLAAAWMIEKSGWKGRSHGRVGVHDKQALVLVNLGGATGADVLTLAQAISQDVQSQFGIELEVEPVII